MFHDLEPCGFCLTTDGLCTICLYRRHQADHIDVKKSQCPHATSISLAKAAATSECSPCTNQPLQCPLCPEYANAVWKYNLWSHISSTHPTANVMLYEHLWGVSNDECTLMRREYLNVP